MNTPTSDSNTNQMRAMRDALERAGHAVEAEKAAARQAKLDLSREREAHATTRWNYEQLRGSIESALAENKRLRLLVLEITSSGERAGVEQPPAAKVEQKWEDALSVETEVESPVLGQSKVRRR